MPGSNPKSEPHADWCRRFDAALAAMVKASAKASS